MKKFLFLCFTLLIASMVMFSCKDVKPEFKFDLELTGDVADAPTQITSDFNVAVTNIQADSVQKVIFLAAPCKAITEPEGADALQWLDSYIQTNVISEMGPETVYYIHVVGMVHESVSGITFSVDKEFSNR